MTAGAGGYEIFLKVVELQSITKAAEALNYTQSGVSHAIAALEAEMGLSLFVRHKRGVTLTRHGEEILDAVRSLVNQQHNLKQVIDSAKNQVTGTIRIGTYLSISVAWLPQIIKSFQARYPKVEFELEHGIHETVTQGILQGRLDCGFMAVPKGKNIFFHPLLDDPMMVALPPGHPLCAKESLSLEDIKDEPFVLSQRGYDVDILRVLSPMGYPSRMNYIINDDISMMAMVSNGFGISIIPRLLLRICNFGLEARPMNPAQFRTLGIAALPLGTVSTTTRRFLEFLMEDAVKLDLFHV